MVWQGGVVRCAMVRPGEVSRGSAWFGRLGMEW